MSIESIEVEPPRMALSADEIASVAKGIRRVNFMLLERWKWKVVMFPNEKSRSLLLKRSANLEARSRSSEDPVPAGVLKKTVNQ